MSLIQGTRSPDHLADPYPLSGMYPSACRGGGHMPAHARPVITRGERQLLITRRHRQAEHGVMMEMPETRACDADQRVRLPPQASMMPNDGLERKAQQNSHILCIQRKRQQRNDRCRRVRHAAFNRPFGLRTSGNSSSSSEEANDRLIGITFTLSLAAFFSLIIICMCVCVCLLITDGVLCQFYFLLFSLFSRFLPSRC